LIAMKGMFAVAHHSKSGTELEHPKSRTDFSLPYAHRAD
jgi:hypothetical protein